jgi:hypothetical protein
MPRDATSEARDLLDKMLESVALMRIHRAPLADVAIAIAEAADQLIDDSDLDGA